MTTTSNPLQTPIHPTPLQIAEETYLLRSAHLGFGAPLSVYVNAMLIRGAEPILVDTSSPANHSNWLADVSSLVDLEDIRWVFISHDDEDHTGGLEQVLQLCPNATVVWNWAMNERLSCAFNVPPARQRWLDDGDVLDVGDRELKAIRPPAYDSPTTRGLYDPSTGVYWASDAFATPMPAQPVDNVEDLPPGMWVDGMAMFHHHALSPWLSMVNRDAYAAEVAKLGALDLKAIASAHAPLVTGSTIRAALEQMAALPDVVPPPHPDQNMLEAMLAGASGG